jgi:hypothetical protein
VLLPRAFAPLNRCSLRSSAHPRHTLDL